ncbi:MAG: hypothetical protein RIS99_1124 [Bacteroidota bacterium]|jgi:hypothetical protein
MKNIYLDIDGVILTRQGKPALHAEEFIEYITTHFQVFWLTTHCKGKPQTAVQYLSTHFGSQTLEHLSKIQPTVWDTLKTEAIDFQSDFFWLEDQPFSSEIKILELHSALPNLINVDLQHIDELQHLKFILENG